MILEFDWRVFLVMFTVEIAVDFVANYICFVPLTVSVAFPIVYFAMRRDVCGALILCVIIPVIFYKHVENLKRIKSKS